MVSWTLLYLNLGFIFWDALQIEREKIGQWVKLRPMSSHLEWQKTEKKMKSWINKSIQTPALNIQTVIGYLLNIYFEQTRKNNKQKTKNWRSEKIFRKLANLHLKLGFRHWNVRSDRLQDADAGLNVPAWDSMICI